MGAFDSPVLCTAYNHAKDCSKLTTKIMEAYASLVLSYKPFIIVRLCHFTIIRLGKRYRGYFGSYKYGSAMPSLSESQFLILQSLPMKDSEQNPNSMITRDRDRIGSQSLNSSTVKKAVTLKRTVCIVCFLFTQLFLSK